VNQYTTTGKFNRSYDDMKIVVAMDSFKGSLTAQQACQIAAEGFACVVPDLEIVLRPMADGGEGTAQTMIAARGGKWIKAEVTGPLPEMRVETGFAFFENDKTALVEMATASGMQLLSVEQLNPLNTTTYGTGELIKAAADYGAKRILLAVGGSATVDGGVGAATALGWRFLDGQGLQVGLGGGELERICQIIRPEGFSGRKEFIGLPEMRVLCDVNNPLCGSDGAARVFAPQKGATPEMVERLEEGLRHLANIVGEQLGLDIANIAGGGAAGGLAAGAAAFMNAKPVPGIKTIIEASGLREDIEDADWIITGEGKLDSQSLYGKVVSGIAELANETKVKVGVIAGSVELADEQWRRLGIADAAGIRTKQMSLDYALNRCRELLRKKAQEFAGRYFAH
jgi:glycerate kinase